jgi:flagellar secretion chaperone FliS
MVPVMDDPFAQQAHRDYLESRVFSAHPVERVQMLYQIAIENVNTAIARFRDGDIFARGRAVNKAHEAVDELILALDHSVGASFTHTLAELYRYVQRQLIAGHTQKSEEAFQQALSVLTTLADAWKEVVIRTLGSGAPDHDSPDSTVHAPAEFAESRSAYGGAPVAVSTSSRDWSG